MSAWSCYALKVTVSRTWDILQIYHSCRPCLLAFQLLPHRGFQHPRDSTIALVLSTAVSSHIHVVRVNAFDRLQRLGEVEFRRKVVYYLQLTVSLASLCGARRIPSSLRPSYL